MKGRKGTLDQHRARQRPQQRAAGGGRHSPYTHTRTMLNTGGMGGKRRKARKRRLEGAAAGVRAERDREWVLDRLCALVFEGMAGARQGKGERARGQSAMRSGDQPRG